MGPDLLTVTHEGRETLLYPLVAAHLASKLDVSSANLPAGQELQEVSRRFLLGSREPQEIYRSLRLVFRELDPISIPAPLAMLARIPNLKLFVTTTFDFLTEGALDRERFGGPRQTLSFAYAPSDKQDLPPELDRLNRPAVFHLMGRLSGTPHSYAVTREDRLEFTRSLESKTGDSPGFLFDKLRASDLLLMGADLAPWLVRLLGRSLLDQDSERSPVLFVDHLGGVAEAWGGGKAGEFVSDLFRRWTELRAEEFDPASSIPQESFPSRIAAGSVFLSCASADRGAGETLREELDRAGVDVVLELDDLPLTERRDQKLMTLLGGSSAFVPVISKRGLSARRRFFRSDWVEALLEAEKAAPGGRFVLPVAIDDTAPGERAVPEQLGEIPWERLRDGKASSEFVKMVVRLQRSCRSARTA